MFNYTKDSVLQISKEYDFISNNVEKVLRLIDVLNIIQSSKYGKFLCLKGGTAINVFLLDLPRLSVDIDLDFSFICNREEMLSIRVEIEREIIKLLSNEMYQLKNDVRRSHSLDSFVFNYKTLSSSIDVLKIDINYSNRIHILNAIECKKNVFGQDANVTMLSDLELIGSKMSALIIRTTQRDLFDVYNLLSNYRLDYLKIKKIALFYIAMSEDKPIDIYKAIYRCIERIRKMNFRSFKMNLIPMLHKGYKCDFEEIKKYVITYLEKAFILCGQENDFFESFNKGKFNQQLLFEDWIVSDLSMHPMVIWKTGKDY